jgi:hypothetical protein
MSSDVTKRALSAGLGIGALALLAPRASADTPFSGFAFPTTGAPTARTMPDRLAEVKNVKDFGAVGNGAADDTAAIQTAVDWTTGANRGLIFFPAGTYRITAPITANFNGELSIIFQGVGFASRIIGSVNGPLIDRSNENSTSGIRVIEKLDLKNEHPSGTAIRWLGSVGSAIRDCRVNAFIGCDVSGNGGGFAIQNLHCTGGGAPGSIGICAGGHIAIHGCDITGWDHGIRCSLGGQSILGCRLEVNNQAIVLGLDRAGNVMQTNANIIGGCTFEANQTAIRVGAADGFTIHSIALTGGVSMSRGLWLESAAHGLISGVAISGHYSVAGIDTSGSNGRVVFIACNATTTGGSKWLVTNPNNVQFIACNYP